MKTKNRIASALIITSLLMGGCSKQEISPEAVDPAIKQDAIAYYGKVITLKDFPEDKFLPSDIHNRLNEKVDTGGIASSPEKALVPFSIDDNGLLYTAKRYNTESEKSIKGVSATTYYTDLETFRKVTGLKEATAEYAMPMPGASGNPIWVFDPYVSYFTKRSEYQNQKKPLINYESQARIEATPSWAQLGNIIMARWDGGGISDVFGHTGGIVQSPLSSSTNRGFLMQSTRTVEASNSGKSLAGVTIGTQNGVFERNMSSNGSDLWNSSSVYQRYAMWYPGMTTTQRNAIVTYMRAQIGEPYLYNDQKEVDTYWYCSKIQYKAYKAVLGINIDSNNGFYVLPQDIVSSSLLVGISF